MDNINFEIIERLLAIIKTDPVDWQAFDDVLDSLEDINAIDEDAEETYLSDCLRDFYDDNFEEKMLEVVRRFLAKGYDLKANEGRNGAFCLLWLCYVYKKDIIEIAKLLLNAGAPTDYPSAERDKENVSAIMEGIHWKLSGAWVVDKDFSWANTMETYCELIEAFEAKKPFNEIATYHACIGKTFERAEIIGKEKLRRNDNGIAQFENSLVFWFDKKPLIISKYIDFVVNPNTVSDNKDNLSEANDVFQAIIGSVLQNIIYLNQSTCYFEFDNGQRLLLTSIDGGEKGRIGLLEIREAETCKADVLDINAICFWDNKDYAKQVILYTEDVLALIKNNLATLIFTTMKENCEPCISAITCSLDFAKDFNQQLPIESPNDIKLFCYGNGLKAICFQCGDYYLYAQVNSYRELDIKLSSEAVILTEDIAAEDISGIHMDFKIRK